MTAELWLHRPCVHGFIDCGELICNHQPGEHPKDEHGTTWACWCPGGSRVRLDPDKVVFKPWAVDAMAKAREQITVQDVIDALDQEEE